MKYQIRWSDTCDCKHIQTYQPELEPDGVSNDAAWGTVETYTNPAGKVYNTERCAIHAAIPTADIFDVLINKECRRRNLAALELSKLPKYAAMFPEETDASKKESKTIEYLMSKCTFSGVASDRLATFDLGELTNTEKTAVKKTLEDKFGKNKIDVK